MTLVFHTRPMPPMIHGHPDLGESDLLYPHGGGPIFIPETMGFFDDEGNEDEPFDEFEYDLIMSLMTPVGGPYLPREVQMWLGENDPAWLPTSRPSAVRNDLQHVTPM